LIVTARNLRYGKSVFAASLLLAANGASISAAEAAAQDYRFELVGKPTSLAGKDMVQVWLVHAADGKPVFGAVIVESKADMGPAGMPTIPAPVEALPAKGGLYGFEVDPGVADTWTLHLAAKVPDEAEIVRGAIDVDLVP
jgi:YtkA-like